MFDPSATHQKQVAFFPASEPEPKDPSVLVSSLGMIDRIPGEDRSERQSAATYKRQRLARSEILDSMAEDLFFDGFIEPCEVWDVASGDMLSFRRSPITMESRAVQELPGHFVQNGSANLTGVTTLSVQLGDPGVGADEPPSPRLLRKIGPDASPQLAGFAG